jgi:tRNA pseudouridine55 synthase
VETKKGIVLPFGLLNIHKPPRVTSADVVGWLKRLVRPDKIGHAGTLDPIAEGVLVVAIGSATRLIDYVQQMPKRYWGTFLLGRRSPSDDTEIAAEELVDPPIPSLADLERGAAALVGEIQQRPPAFSAVKVAGRRAYQLARAGRTFDLAARPVTVYELRIAEYEYPRVVLDIRCGSGTYVRSLGRDLAESLGTAAVMSALVRTAIGPFRLEDAANPRSITKENLDGVLLPALQAVPSLPVVRLADDEITAVLRGLALPAGREIPAGLTAGQECAAVDRDGELAAILRLRADGTLTPACNLRQAEPPSPGTNTNPKR